MFKTMQTPILSSSALQEERFYSLDAVRAIALVIGIFFHGVESLVSFMPPLVWAVKDTESSAVLDIFFYVAHVFRMQAFFLIAGFFAHMLYHRRGPKEFMIHRAKRIGLPLIIFWPVILVLVQLLWTWGYKQMGYLAMNPATAKLGYWEIVKGNFASFMWMSNGFPLTHLWFLYMLLWLCAGILIMRPLFVKWIDKQGKIRAGADKVLGYLMQKGWGSVMLGLLTIPAMWDMKNGFGVDTPDNGLLFRWAPLLVYGLYFTLGWLLHRQAGLLEMFKKHRKTNLLLSVLFTAIVAFSFFSVVYNLPAPGQQPTTPPVDASTIQLLTVIFNSLYGIASMTGVFAFIGWMMAWFSNPNRLLRYVSDASYWMYLIHLPVVVFFQILVFPFQWHWLIKVLFILVPSFSVLLLSYQFLVRHTWIGVLLNGRRYSSKKENMELTHAIGPTN